MMALFALDGVKTTRGRGDDHVHPLFGVDATIPAGVVTALVGPSGAGKSTLLRLLNRMEEPTSGRVLFHGRPLPEYDVLSLRRRVGLLLQRPTPFPGTVLDNLRVGRPQLEDTAATALLDRVGLGAAFLTRDAEQLSGGEAQRVCLARALAVGPEVLLLDEPTSALDAFAARVVEEVVQDLADDGLSIVLVSHDLRQARRLANHLVVVHTGNVVAQGPVAAVFEEPGNDDAAAFLRGVS